MCLRRHEGPSLLHFYWDESCLTAFNKMHLHLIFPQNISCTLSWTNEVNLHEVLVRETHFLLHLLFLLISRRHEGFFFPDKHKCSKIVLCLVVLVQPPSFFKKATDDAVSACSGNLSTLNNCVAAGENIASTNHPWK